VRQPVLVDDEFPKAVGHNYYSGRPFKGYASDELHATPHHRSRDVIVIVHGGRIRKMIQIVSYEGNVDSFRKISSEESGQRIRCHNYVDPLLAD